MPLLPLFYLHHRADGTAVLVSRGQGHGQAQAAEASRDVVARLPERPATAGLLAAHA
ncbi:hypothetical protein [Antarcticirhabdus aurantiaca]|uniref:Uncharacterized protein n=1 Tax=Antarcticirhabdus aurantiaca TaxID=2606717 RepID=A0ACD4NRM6_9HYPH|nr:hypothetical protein [Antarcticirhabdus aurantiaca]WAJ29605.1 hypothetical protein OXU80_05055 [Jeongeuplla avenae]